MIDKKPLEELYFNQGMSIRQIGLKLDKDHKTICRWFEIHGIKKRDIRLPKNELARLYLEEMKSTYQIGSLFNCSHEKVRRNLKHYDIPIRHGGEAIKTQWIDNPERRKKQSEWAKINGEKQKGKNHAQWKGGVEYTELGYRLVYCPGHPRAHYNKVREHVLIMEEKIGRYLTDNEIVHHIDEIKDHNELWNLQLMTRAEHTNYHAMIRKWRKLFMYLMYEKAA